MASKTQFLKVAKSLHPFIYNGCGIALLHSRQRRLYSAVAPYNPKKKALSGFSIWLRELDLNHSRQRRLYSAIAPYNPKKKALSGFSIWLRELDLNQRPSGYEPDELPSCSIPRHILSFDKNYYMQFFPFCQHFFLF